MKRILLAGIGLVAILGAVSGEAWASDTHKNGIKRRDHSVYRGLLAAEKTLEKDYADFKKRLAAETGLSYSLDVSVLGQRGSPGGKGTPWQTQYYGTANWDMFQSDTWGSGSAQIAYTAVRYWGTNAARVNNRIGLVSAFNDYTTNENEFNQLSYTHQLPGDLSGLSLTVGQFPISNFDGGSYDSNQQINFLNDSLSQNASSAYPTASLGGYVTYAPNNLISLTAGFQDAHNVAGNRISTHDFGKGHYTGFAGVSYTPMIEGLGQGTYSFLYYYQPSVGAQPQTSQGWSVNLQQNIGDKWGVFARANGTTHTPTEIEQSYVLGVVYNNPLGRNALDQIGLAGAVNKIDTAENSGTRAVENVLEAYWAWGVSNFMTITPDVQFYINPGANQNHRTATVSSIRATLMF